MALAQALMAVPPRVGQHHHGPSISRVLRPGVQPGASAFGISRTDPGRDVFRHRGRGASRPGVTRGHRKAGPRGGQPIGRLRDVPLNRRGRLTTNSCPSVDHRDPRPVRLGTKPPTAREHEETARTCPGSCLLSDNSPWPPPRRELARESAECPCRQLGAPPRRMYTPALGQGPRQVARVRDWP